MKPCMRCGSEPSINGERYCKTCRGVVLELFVNAVMAVIASVVIVAMLILAFWDTISVSDQTRQNITISDVQFRRTVFRHKVNGTNTGVLATVGMRVPQTLTGRVPFVAFLHGSECHIRTIRLFRIVGGEEHSIPVGWDDRNHESKVAYEFEVDGLDSGAYRIEFAIRGAVAGRGSDMLLVVRSAETPEGWINDERLRGHQVNWVSGMPYVEKEPEWGEWQACGESGVLNGYRPERK